MARPRPAVPKTDPELESENAPSQAPQSGDTDTGESIYEADLTAFLQSLKPQVRDKATIYVYRTWPRGKKVKGGKALQTYPARIFNYGMLEEDEGGGKFKIMADIGDNQRHTFYFQSPKPAIIHPDYILVDENDNPIVPAAAPAVQPATRDDITAAIHATTAAAKTGNDATQEALKAGIGLMATASDAALKIVVQAKQDTAGAAGDNPAIASLLAKLEKIEAELRNRETQGLRSEVESLRAELRQRATPAPNDVAVVSQAANILGVEGGLMGMVKAVGGSGDKDEGFLDHLGKGLSSGIETVIKQVGPDLVQGFREWVYVRRLEALTKREQAGMGAPPAAAPPAPSPPRAAEPPLPAQGQTFADPPSSAPPSTQDFTEILSQEISGADMDVAEMLKKQIPLRIRQCWDRGFTGEVTAEVMKDEFTPFLGLLRMQFSDLHAVIELAKKDPVLAPITTQSGFLGWAEQFFETFHQKDSGEETPPAA